MTDNTEGMSRSEILGAEIARLENSLGLKREAIKEHQPLLEELTKKYEAIREELLKVRHKKDETEVTIRNLKNDAKPLEDELAIKRRDFQRALMAERAANDLREAFASFERDTMDAKWRKNHLEDEGAFAHQLEAGMEMAFGKRFLLADRMGLGKSLSAIVACDMAKSKKIILFGPNKTLKNFENEINYWVPERTLVSIRGQNPTARMMYLNLLKKTDEWVITVNLEAWRRDPNLVNELCKLGADTVLVDEAHKINKTTTTFNEGVRSVVYAANTCIVCGGNELFSNGDHGAATIWTCVNKDCSGRYRQDDQSIYSVKQVFLLTGTPLLNRAQEMFPLLHLIDRVQFPSESMFLKEFCYKYGKGNRWAFEHGAVDRIMKLLPHNYMARTRKDAGITIPPQKIQTVEIEWDPAKYPLQTKVYEQLCQAAMIVLDANDPTQQMTVNEYITLLMRWRQVFTYPAGIQWIHPKTGELLFKCDIKESFKIDAAVELIKDFKEEQERSVLFSKFKPGLYEIKNRLEKEGVSAVVLDGSTPDYIVDQIMIDFDNKYVDASDPGNYRWDVVLCNYDVGGESLNFTGATQTIVLDREWNPGKQNQAYGRTDRMGQTKETTVHVLEVINCPFFNIDDYMRHLNEEKARIVDGYEFDSTKAIAELKKRLMGGN